jgi:hypothetical protein
MEKNVPVFVITDTYGVVDVELDSTRAYDRYNMLIDENINLGSKIIEEKTMHHDHKNLVHETIFDSREYSIRLERWNVSH